MEVQQSTTRSRSSGRSATGPRGPSLARRRRQSSGAQGPPQLHRMWSLRARGGRGAAGAPAALPFLQVDVSVLDSLDVMRSSFEEEIVFQATLQVPAHQALACRFEALESPFSAPSLSAAPEALTEDERQFAACIASPPEMEEAHSFSFRAASAIQRTAPTLRATASGLVTMSFSMRQRSSNCRNCDGAADDDADGAGDALDGLAQHVSGGGSSSGTHHRLARAASHGPWLAAARSASLAIPEEEADAAVTAVAAEAAANAAPASSHASSSLARPEQPQPQQQQHQPQHQPQGLMRLTSITPAGTRVCEVPFTAQLKSKGVSALLGVGFMLVQTLNARLQPAGQLRTQLAGVAPVPPPPEAAAQRITFRAAMRA